MNRQPLLLLGATLGALGCTTLGIAPLCGDELISEARSPDGQRVAGVFTRDCGATTAKSSHVYIYATGTRFSQAAPGNVVVVVDDNHSRARLDGDHVPIRVTWKDQRTLEVAYPAAARAFRHADLVDDVSVFYASEDGGDAGPPQDWE